MVSGHNVGGFLMPQVMEWVYRGLTCKVTPAMGHYEYILEVETPHGYPCHTIERCRSWDEAVSKTNRYADCIADLLDPINY